jgi:hypothetical protein
MDSSQRTVSWTSSVWRTVQRCAAALVSQADDDGILPQTSQHAHQLETQHSRDVAHRQELLNSMGKCVWATVSKLPCHAMSRLSMCTTQTLPCSSAQVLWSVLLEATCHGNRSGLGFSRSLV